MSSPAVDMATALQSAGVGTTGVDIFVNVQPTDPDQCITLRDTGSWREPEKGLDLYYPLVQALIRGGPNQFVPTYALAETVRDTILGLSPQTINLTKYNGFWCNSDILTLGQDQQRRNLFSVNFRLMRST